jgi:carbon-monoxide dehydrogenase small subunit
VPKTLIRFTVNRQPQEVEAYPMSRLLDVLREDLHLTGTKEGCGEGECGACSVMLDGRLVNSCLIPVLQAEGATIQTIEGVAHPNPDNAHNNAHNNADNDAHDNAHSEPRPRGSGTAPSNQPTKLHKIQQSFITHGAAQCGICTPGMVMAAIELLSTHPDPTDAQIRTGLAGNICRCTGYMRIFEAIVKAVKE